MICAVLRERDMLVGQPLVDELDAQRRGKVEQIFTVVFRREDMCQLLLSVRPRKLLE